MGRGIHKILTAILLMGFILYPTVYSENPQPSFLTLTIYSDGYVFVEYYLSLDPKSPMANFSVFGEDLIDMVVSDNNGLSLEYSVNGEEITINSLGIEEVKLTYFTQDLTQKDSRFWILNFTSPVQSTLIFPSKATIIDFNKIPELIESDDDQTLLVMSEGKIEITYVTSVVGTKEYAQIIISEAEKTIQEIKNLKVIITDAETILLEAKQEFNIGNYIKAETNGKKAKTTAIQINNTASQANSSIIFASTEVEKAEKNGRTEGLSEAKNLHNQALTAYQTGNYTQALSLASQAITKAQLSTTPFPLMQAVGIIGFTGVVAGYMMLKVRKKEEPKIVKPKKAIDVEKIIKNKELRPEEIEAVRIIGEADGEIYEVELYSKLNLPRTTTWRLVKRLEDMAVVEIKKVRRSNVIRLKK
ncbi:hypothetical protein FJY84_07545 [Candidatus Bathyarchaeota archaeon]|nr:hypothetical protein [Candidatus Bathyarchaeota archaeon]